MSVPAVWFPKDTILAGGPYPGGLQLGLLVVGVVEILGIVCGFCLPSLEDFEHFETANNENPATEVALSYRHVFRELNSIEVVGCKRAASIALAYSA